MSYEDMARDAGATSEHEIRQMARMIEEDHRRWEEEQEERRRQEEEKQKRQP